MVEADPLAAAFAGGSCALAAAITAKMTPPVPSCCSSAGLRAPRAPPAADGAPGRLPGAHVAPVDDGRVPAGASVEKAMNRVQDLGWMFAGGLGRGRDRGSRSRRSRCRRRRPPPTCLSPPRRRRYPGRRRSGDRRAAGPRRRVVRARGPARRRVGRVGCDEHPDEASLECEIDWASNKPAYAAADRGSAGARRRPLGRLARPRQSVCGLRCR